MTSSNRSISVNTFQDFFNLNDKSNKTPSVGKPILNPFTIITKYNITKEEYWDMYLNKPTKTRDPFRPTQAKKFDLNNYINNNHIYQVDEEQNLPSDNSCITESPAIINTTNQGLEPSPPTKILVKKQIVKKPKVRKSNSIQRDGAIITVSDNDYAMDDSKNNFMPQTRVRKSSIMCSANESRSK